MIRVILLSSVILFLNCSNQSKASNNNDSIGVATLEQLQRTEESLTNSIKNNKAEIESQLDELQKKIKNSNDNAFIFVGLISSIVLVILIIGIILLFLNRKSFKRNILNEVLSSYELEKMISTKIIQSQRNQSTPLAFSENRILEIIKKERELFDNQINKVQEIRSQKDEMNKTHEYVKTSIPKYLKGKSGNKFNIADSSSEGSFFRIINENNDFAQFEFYGIQEEAIAKRVFSEDISRIISGSYENWKFVKTVIPGEIKQVGDYWEVTKPIEVKLI